MKLFFFFLILFPQLALAENFQFGNEEIGYLNVRTEDTGPAYERYRMYVTVTCKDRRRVKNLVSPVAEEIIPVEDVCILLKPTYNEKTTDVTVIFGKSTREVGEGKCTDGYTQTFNIEKLCSAWSN
jgi:hypothetical protein